MTMTTEQQAIDLINEICKERGRVPGYDTEWIDREEDVYDEALCRSIELYEDYRNEVSESLALVLELLELHGLTNDDVTEILNDYIIKPVDPILIKARKLVADYLPEWEKNDCLIGCYDNRDDVLLAFMAINLGMELAKEQKW